MDPWVRNPQADREPGPFREGDKVSFAYGSTVLVGTIVEDRGNLGYQRRRLYDIRVPQQDVPEDMEIELPADVLTLVEKAPEPKKKGKRRS